MVKRSDDLFKAAKSVDKRGFRFLWVIDENEEILGWIDTTRLIRNKEKKEDVITRIPVSRIAVRSDFTCKTALSRMLAEGIKVVPVVDENQKIIGEISLADIEKITEEVAHTWQE